MKSMNNRIFWLLVALCLPVFSWAISLPEHAVGKPKIFMDESKSYSWQEIARNHNFGDYSSNPWYVYVLSEGVRATESAGGGTTISTLKFMEQFRVAEISGKYLLLYCDDQIADGDKLLIPKKVRTRESRIESDGIRSDGYVGWVSSDDLLLWTICPRTDDGVYQKVAIVRDVDDLSTRSASGPARMYTDINCLQSKGVANALDIYFAFYYAPSGNVLVTNVSDTKGGKMVTQRVGWIKRGDFIKWNTRICWEPAFNTVDNEGKINKECVSYANQRAADNCEIDHVVSQVPLNGKRKPALFPRCPVLNYQKGIAELAVIGNYGKETSSGLDPIETMKKIKALEESVSKINVVFVMDASNSMRSCFQAMSDAVADIIRSKDYRDHDVNFGVVAYRNYRDELKGRLVSKLDFTKDPNKVIDFLNNTECRSDEHNDPQEALFYGLNYAVDNMNWSSKGSNFIILISDVSNKEPDAKGITSAKLIDKLAGKHINLVAFQARSQPDPAYMNFGSQMSDIIKGLLKKEGYTSAKPVKTKHQTFMFEQEAKLPFRPMGFKWKSSQDQNINPSELTSMIIGTLRVFIQKTDDNIALLRNAINGSSSDSGDEELNKSLANWLVREGIIKSAEDLKNIGGIKVKGHSTMYYCRQSENQMWTPCIFMAEKELTELIANLSNVTRSSSANRRGELQRECLRMILMYTGQQDLSSTQLNDPNLSYIIKEIEKECGYRFHPDVKAHILNPNKLNDSEFESLCALLKKEVEELRTQQNKSSNYWVNQGLKYYYIHLDTMPLIEQN